MTTVRYEFDDQNLGLDDSIALTVPSPPKTAPKPSILDAI